MKKLFVYCMSLAAIAATTTGCPSPTPVDPNEFAVDFTEAYIEYWFDELENGAGNWELFFYRDEAGNDYTELFLDLVTDYYEDALRAVMAAGSYSFATTHAKFTITEESSFHGYAGTENIGDVAVKGGTVEVKRTGSHYSFAFDLELANGKVLKCGYDGDYYQEYGANLTSDVTLSVSNPWDADVEAEPVRDGLWAIMMDMDTSATTWEFVTLTINTDAGLTALPAGEFPMASAPRRGVTGTAEPSFLSDDWEETGCFYRNYNESTDKEQYAWAVPNEGFVNIVDNGDDDYTIDFSFEDPNGYTVSGRYSGYVDNLYGLRSAKAKVKKWRENHSLPTRITESRAD